MTIDNHYDINNINLILDNYVLDVSFQFKVFKLSFHAKTSKITTSKFNTIPFCPFSKRHHTNLTFVNLHSPREKVFYLLVVPNTQSGHIFSSLLLVPDEQWCTHNKNKGGTEREKVDETVGRIGRACTEPVSTSSTVSIRYRN